MKKWEDKKDFNFPNFFFWLGVEKLRDKKSEFV